MARKKCKGTELSVFKGREAKLNRAIFQTLALKGPQTIYHIHKATMEIKGLRRTHYGNVNKRVRALEELGFLSKVDVQITKAGFEAIIYDLSIRAYLALLFSGIDINSALSKMDENVSSNILAAFVDLL